jgi:hypothetical protein
MPLAQLRLWRELSAVPDEFDLYGGTAIALHLGHRTSVDFDFFGGRTLNLEALEDNIPFLRDAKIIQREKNTLTAIVDRGEPEDLKKRLVDAVRQVDLDHLPALDRNSSWFDDDYEQEI